MKAGHFVIHLVMALWTVGFLFAVWKVDLSAFQLVALLGIAVANVMLYELIGFVGKLKISFVPQKKEDE